jgi:phospholipid/cholesterol/gamma-HCH transport system permease protein
MIALPLLVLVANGIGVFGGYLLSVNKLHFNGQNYLSISRQFLEADDIIMSSVKAGVFGFFMALMGCYAGFTTQGGAAGVGKSTTNAVVSSFVLILLSNLLITVIAFG